MPGRADGWQECRSHRRSQRRWCRRGGNIPMCLYAGRSLLSESMFSRIMRARSSNDSVPCARHSDAQIYRFYTCAKNHCDVDSVTFSCVTAAPVRTPHLPCLSLFLVYRNHFNELNSLLQTPGLACPVFPVCGCKGTTKNQYQPNISATFFQEFFANFC